MSFYFIILANLIVLPYSSNYSKKSIIPPFTQICFHYSSSIPYSNMLLKTHYYTYRLHTHVL